MTYVCLIPTPFRSGGQLPPQLFGICPYTLLIEKSLFTDCPVNVNFPTAPLLQVLFKRQVPLSVVVKVRQVQHSSRRFSGNKYRTRVMVHKKRFRRNTYFLKIDPGQTVFSSRMKCSWIETSKFIPFYFRRFIHLDSKIETKLKCIVSKMECFL